MATHTVFNQTKPLTNYDLLSSDLALTELLSLYGAQAHINLLCSFGKFAGSEKAIQMANLANQYTPTLSTHDTYGNRIDRVDFHPSYHQLMAESIAHNIHSLPWLKSSPEASHTARAALLYMSFQNEAGHCCPVSMTYSAIPSLRKQADLSVWLEPLILTNTYDERFLPYGQKRGLTIGMGMTEKQGGSDVRSNTSRARPLSTAGAGKEYLLTGHKWFCSAPMSDMFLMLAQTERGLSCFLVPRWKPDGTLNSLQIQRLKDKLGNKSNASSELEFTDAFAWLIGEEGRGVSTIIEMVNHTRLDCILGATALMRQASIQAINHANYRHAFGRRLREQPIMKNVLADLAIESEAALQLAMRVASSYDKQKHSEQEALFRRIGSAITKYWVCKRAPMHLAEALECFGGNGYVETGPMARLFRESPLLGIWEGSGNVICLDVLRASAKEPETLEAIITELASVRGANKNLDRNIKSIETSILKLIPKASESKKTRKNSQAFPESQARLLIERIALSLQASLLVKNSPSFVADTFIASRIYGQSGFAFGTLTDKGNFDNIIERALPSLK